MRKKKPTFMRPTHRLLTHGRFDVYFLFFIYLFFFGGGGGGVYQSPHKNKKKKPPSTYLVLFSFTLGLGTTGTRNPRTKLLVDERGQWQATFDQSN